MLGNIEGKRKREGQRMRWSSGITDSIDMSLSKFRNIVKVKEAWRAAVHEVAKSQHDLATEQQQPGKAKRTIFLNARC